MNANIVLELFFFLVAFIILSVLSVNEPMFLLWQLMFKLMQPTTLHLLAHLMEMFYTRQNWHISAKVPAIDEL